MEDLGAMFMIIRSPKELALLVRYCRKENKLSQADAASLVGLKQTTVSAFENKPVGTKLDTLFRILSAVNVELHFIPKEKASEPGIDKSWKEEW